MENILRIVDEKSELFFYLRLINMCG
jgi:hypothetical protein